MLNQLPYLNFHHYSHVDTLNDNASHVLYLCPNLSDFSQLQNTEEEYNLHQWLLGIIHRKNLELKKLENSFICGDYKTYSLSSCFVDLTKTTFEQHTVLRKAIQPLFKENPSSIHVIVSPLFKDASLNEIKQLLQKTIFILWLNSAPLPNRQKDHKPPKLNQINIHADQSIIEQLSMKDFDVVGSIAEGNILTRALTMLPSNELTTESYQESIIQFAQKHHLFYKIYDKNELKSLNAGAFLAVTQGNPDSKSSIIYLSYLPKKPAKTIPHVGLVGKGVCFDTGGHQLKPAKYMQHMNQDMNGSAVVLGILKAVHQLQLPIKLDVWLAIADNYLSPMAYKPQDVVTSCNGTTIEIIHTDAEGRMILADTLTLASREKPQYLIDFATLTGSCVDAVGSNYSGLLSNNEQFIDLALKVSKQTGERLCAFPFDDDYTEALDSDIADVKQCTLDSEADHILGAKFLQKFIENEDQIQWGHVDLSASHHEKGLGAVDSDVTGFGVHWCVELLRRLI